VPGSRRTALGGNLLLLFASLFVTALLIESLLQAASILYRWTHPESAAVAPHGAREGEYRILCLGESTTRGFRGTAPYPRLLEEELNRRDFGISFSVHNAGFTSWSTDQLVRVLPKLLEQVDPDMVIAMMGINDQFYFSDAERLGIPLDVQLVLLKSRFYKLLRLVWFNASARFGEGPSRSDWYTVGRAPSHPTPEFAEYKRLFWIAHRKWLQRRLEDPDRVFRRFIQAARRAAQPGRSAGHGTIDVPPEYLRPYYNVYLDLAEFYLESGSAEKAVELYREAIAAHPDAEFFYRGLSGVYEKIGRRDLSEKYRGLSEDLASEHLLPVTRDSYRRLHEILQRRGVEFVAMQYPLRSLRKLRFLLDNAEDPIYVDNEQVFREAIEKSSYDELFIDRFAGDFGHCADRGNRLIVDNLIATVFEPTFGAPARSLGGAGLRSQERSP
jgi:tetratricopeptide (TPR) repeat protein